MIQTKQLVPDPTFDPSLPVNYMGPGKINREKMWKYETLGRPLQAGDLVEFLCNGRGRGNHLRVHARITKVNRKTFKATELPGSYSPGTLWNVNIAYALESGNGGITVDLSHKD